MPWGTGPSVVHRNGHDYWRTWFVEECESAQLFGLTMKHLPLVTKHGPGVGAYREGTQLFLEDAPYFRASKEYHRVCGPYEVFSLSTIPHGAVPVHLDGKKVIVFKETHPEHGPWFDHSSVKRTIDEHPVKFRQIASEYDFFPFRFAIHRYRKFNVQHVLHVEACWLCV